MLLGMRPGRGRPAGRPTPGAFAEYDPSDKGKHRVATSIEPEVMPEVIRRLKAMNRSASWYMRELILRDLAEGGALPTWFEEEQSASADQSADVLDFRIPTQSVAASGSHEEARRESSR
ncbi:hypothetical protein GCM10009789_83330 [Kribbella sancticallisti]|uniref:Uncharacterized protein n=1 Tax=Kribbella sancticallisti TaxID=460087 RepID=A0ABN2EVF2_9ACTN